MGAEPYGYIAPYETNIEAAGKSSGRASFRRGVTIW
jgi:hypothetical protein